MEDRDRFETRLFYGILAGLAALGFLLGSILTLLFMLLWKVVNAN